MFLRNAWYVAAESAEIGETPLGRTLLNEPVVIYRGESGQPVALYDECCHRQAPLTLGEVVGDRLRCNYHGLMYEPDGSCVHVPGQTQVPPGARVKSYPAIDKYDWIWLWMGDPAAADETLIPDFHWATEDGWATVGERLPIKGHYQLLVDNLLDLSHLAYTHPHTIGVSDLAEKGKIKTTRSENTVSVVRLTEDHGLPEALKESHQIEGNVDRWSTIEYIPPASVIIESSIVPTGKGKTSEDRRNYQMQMILNFITPETDGSLHYFWRHSRNYKIDDQAAGDAARKRLQFTFNEDKEMVEGQQRNVANPEAPAMVEINADAGTIAGRKLLQSMIDSEQGAMAAQ